MQSPGDVPASRADRASRAYLALILLYTCLAALYFVLRYAGQWSDSDSANLSAANQAVISQATLRPTQSLYALGFAYQALSACISSVTGISVSQLQQIIYPLVSAALGTLVFVVYRILAGDATAGALAALLLFAQPDFLFVISRGSHERVTWLAVLLATLMLAKSFETPHNLTRFAACVGLFHLATFTVIASNTFFGSSFALAVTVSLVAGIAVSHRSGRAGSGTRVRSLVIRLAYIVAVALVIWYLNAFHLYPPAARSILDLQTGVDRAAAVTLGREPTFDPYATISRGWVSSNAYLGVMLPSFLAAGLSFLIWAVTAWRLLRRKSLPLGQPQFLLWLLYGGFGLQLAVGIVLDRLRTISGNLQQRFFPVVMLLGFPLVASAIVDLWRKLDDARARILGLLVGVLILWGSAASLLKATNDPWLSNYWQFWTASEDRALRWVEQHLRYRNVWVSLDGIRLSSHAVAEGFGGETDNQLDTWIIDMDTRDVLVSTVDQVLSVRRSLPLANVGSDHLVYDNGSVVHYHMRPRTPYQR